MKLRVFYIIDTDILSTLNFSYRNSKQLTEDIIFLIKEGFNIDGYNEPKIPYSDEDVFNIINNNLGDATHVLLLKPYQIVEPYQIKELYLLMKDGNYKSLQLREYTFIKNFNYFIGDNVYSEIFFNVYEGVGTTQVERVFNVKYLSDEFNEQIIKDNIEDLRFFYYKEPQYVNIYDTTYEVFNTDTLDFKLHDFIRVRYYTLGAKDNCSNWRAYMQFDGGWYDGINIELKHAQYLNPDQDKLFDFIIINRPLFQLIDYYKFLQSNDVITIGDYDDPIPYVYIHDKDYVKVHQEQVDLLYTLDYVFTTNEQLKYYFSFYRYKPIEVFPNIINPLHIKVLERKNKEIINIGWFGSGGHIKTIGPLKEAIRDILNKYDKVHFYMVSGNEEMKNYFSDLPKSVIMDYNKVFLEFQEYLSNIDINIAPLSKDHIDLNKSPIRVILPGFNGIPSIATQFGQLEKFGAALDYFEDLERDIKPLIIDENYREMKGKLIQKVIKNNLTYSIFKQEKITFFKNAYNAKIRHN